MSNTLKTVLVVIVVVVAVGLALRGAMRLANPLPRLTPEQVQQQNTGAAMPTR